MASLGLFLTFSAKKVSKFFKMCYNDSIQKGYNQTGDMMAHNSKEQLTNALFKAISSGGVENINALIRQGADVNALDKTGAKFFALSGGVAANSHLRGALARLCEKKKIPFALPDRSLCGDNGAMIALAGYYEFKKGNFADTYLNASAYSPLD